MSLRAIVRDYGNQISIFAFGAKSCEKETLGTHTGRNLIFQSNRTTTDYSDSASILHNVNFVELYYSLFFYNYEYPKKGMFLFCFPGLLGIDKNPK